ncbi:MAG: insulinase family protein [Clostridia bacterium]|nr:insulinase family protein [Clostridia bacterium]
MIKRTKIRNNGITFFYEQNLSAGRVTAALFFKAGVLWEKPRKYGVTRFVSRLLFRELTAGAPEDLPFSLRCGRDHTAFLCAAPKELAGEAVAALARLFDAHPFDAASVEDIRRETLREIAAYAPTRADEEERLYFERDNYAVPLCGTANAVAALTAEQLDRWRDLWFARSNACFVLTGGFSDGQGKAIEAFLRELPPRKHKNLNVKPVFPEEQFFRTSASDRLIPTDDEGATVTLLFDVDLCESKPVYADLLRQLLTDPTDGAVCAALRREQLTGAVKGELRLYTGFAVLAISCDVPTEKLADGIAAMADAIAECKEELTEERAAPFFGRYRENRLYRRGDGDRAYDIGLHNFILYTDDMTLPQDRNDAVMEKLLDAADLVLIPDNMKFLIYYNEKQVADLAAVRRSLTAARIRLFV